MFQEWNVSNASIFFIDCQSNTFLLMNIMNSDISKLAVKTPKQSFYSWLSADFKLVLEDRNNRLGATNLNSSEQNRTVNIYYDVLCIIY